MFITLKMLLLLIYTDLKTFCPCREVDSQNLNEVNNVVRLSLSADIQSMLTGNSMQTNSKTEYEIIW